MNSISSNFFFGFPTKKAVDKFNEMTPSEELKNHPIVKRKANLVQGGDFSTPFSMNQNILLDIIEELKTTKDYRTAMLMKQNLGLLMSSAIDDEKREGLNFEAWFDDFKSELFSFYPERKY
jgi:hypothetical protein